MTCLGQSKIIIFGPCVHTLYYCTYFTWQQWKFQVKPRIHAWYHFRFACNSDCYTLDISFVWIWFTISIFEEIILQIVNLGIHYYLLHYGSVVGRDNSPQISTRSSRGSVRAYIFWINIQSLKRCLNHHTSRTTHSRCCLLLISHN